jgi:photosynthetic reaction center cytochrome c subunit
MTKAPFFARVLAVAIALAPLEANSTQSPGTKPNEPAGAGEQAFKNIQVLKGIPESKLYETMNFISASLGVQCTFCHVENVFEKDDKKNKQTARAMIRMQMAINRENFERSNQVTCFSCHRGNSEPAAIPMVADEALKPARNEDAAGRQELPAADEILRKYRNAMGGEEALQKITSLVERGTIGARATPIEYFAKTPDKKISVMHLSNGDNITSFDGTVGWWKNPTSDAKLLDPGNTEILKLDAEFNLALRMREVFNQLIVRRPDRIRDREVNVVDALRPNQSRVRLYFDSQSGLLLRMVRFLETPLGQIPTQIDYDDYRDTGGVKVPYRRTVARAGNPGFTVQIQEVKMNVPIDDARFAMPPAAPK